MLFHRMLRLRVPLGQIVCLAVLAGAVLSAPTSECPSATPEDQQVFVTSNSSCAEFYLCSNGQPHLLTCPGELYFNPDTSQCDYRANVQCDIGASSSAPSSASSAHQSSRRPAPVERTTRRTEADVAAPVCPEVAGPFPVLLPNPSNCSTYYMCAGGVARLMPCPAGLLFNNATWTCDFPRNVVCPELYKPPATVAKLDRLMAARSVGGKTSSPSDQCPEVDGKYPVLLPNLLDCSTFYICSHGEAVLKSCPHGLEFNNSTWTCDFPESAGCTEKEYNADVKETLKSGPVKATPSSEECPAKDGKYPVFLPNPANCSTYYMCSHGVPYLYSCPDHLEFNSRTNTCDFSWRAGCTEAEHTAEMKRVLPSGPVKTSPSLEECPDEDGKYPVFLPNPTNCSTYYMCSHGVPYLYSCPNHLEFNSRTNTCDFSWRAGCTETEGTAQVKKVLPSGPVKASSSSEECPAKDGKYPVFLPNPSDCSTYYMCSHGVPYLYSCPDHLEFNSRTNTCDFSWRAGCTKAEHTAEMKRSLSSGPVTAAPVMLECPAKDGKYPTFLPNPSDCSTYYMCSHGVPYLYNCPGDLEFNSRTNTCDFSWRAGCQEIEGEAAVKQ